jgi:hypothetical protein
VILPVTASTGLELPGIETRFMEEPARREARGVNVRKRGLNGAFEREGLIPYQLCADGSSRANPRWTRPRGNRAVDII